MVLIEIPLTWNSNAAIAIDVGVAIAASWMKVNVGAGLAKTYSIYSVWIGFENEQRWVNNILKDKEYDRSVENSD